MLIKKAFLYTFVSFLRNVIAHERLMAAGEISSGGIIKNTPVKVLAFDFDKTCAKRMVLDIYKAREDYQNNEDVRKTLDEEWQRLEKYYLTISGKVLGPVLKNTKPMSPDFDDTGLRSFLKDVEVIDNLAADELIKSDILKGITADGIMDFAENVELMPDLLNVLQSFKASNLPLHVISLNFSKKLIMDVLFRSGTLPLLVHSNELEFQNGICTGSMDKQFLSAFHKELLLLELVRNAGDDCGITIYIGDSFTDLLALLKADVGLVIGESKSMNKVCKHFGIHVIPLHYWNYARLSEKNAKSRTTLFSVKSWLEIKNFVLSFNKY